MQEFPGSNRSRDKKKKKLSTKKKDTQLGQMLHMIGNALSQPNFHTLSQPNVIIIH